MPFPSRSCEDDDTLVEMTNSLRSQIVPLFKAGFARRDAKDARDTAKRDFKTKDSAMIAAHAFHRGTQTEEESGFKGKIEAREWALKFYSAADVAFEATVKTQSEILSRISSLAMELRSEVASQNKFDLYPSIVGVSEQRVADLQEAWDASSKPGHIVAELQLDADGMGTPPRAGHEDDRSSETQTASSSREEADEWEEARASKAVWDNERQGMAARQHMIVPTDDHSFAGSENDSIGPPMVGRRESIALTTRTQSYRPSQAMTD